MSKDSAFPGKNQFQSGMTLTDYFAGQVLAGVCGDAVMFKSLITDAKSMKKDASEHIAHEAYSLAQAMVDEKKKLIGVVKSTTL